MAWIFCLRFYFRAYNPQMRGFQIRAVDTKHYYKNKRLALFQLDLSVVRILFYPDYKLDLSQIKFYLFLSNQYVEEECDS